MTADIKPVKYDASLRVHTPMEDGDTIDPAVIPLSARTNNRIRSLTDGLYLGDSLAKNIYYVNSDGQNLPVMGDKSSPMQTLEYCLQQILAQSITGSIEGDVTIALKAGQTFALTNSYNVSGRLRLTFYGDANYGDFNSTPIGTGAHPYNMADLARPIIANTVPSTIPRSAAGFRLVGSGSLRMSGIQINLPARPSSLPTPDEYGNLCDFVTATDYSNSSLILEGTIANMTDAQAVYGLLGVHARANANLMQYASQLRVLNALLVDTDAPAQSLIARKYFFKMYYDYPGNNQQQGALVASTANSSTGSGLLKMNWSEVQALTVINQSTNLASFPAMFSQAYGMRNYIFNLVRDQQSRPLNVIASALF